MNLSNLLLDIHPLHPLQILALFQLPIITRRRSLPPRCLFVRDFRLPGRAVEHVTSLRAKSFQVGGDLARG